MLPRDVLAYLLSFVEREDWRSCLEVCKSWREAARAAFDPSGRQNSTIMWACEKGKTDVVRYLLKDSRVDPSVKSGRCIRTACRQGYLPVVQLLLDHPSVDPAVDMNDPICVASQMGHTAVVKLLLSDRRVDPSAFDNYSIRWSAAKGHLEVVKLLLADPRVDPTAKECRVLELTKDYPEVVHELMKHPKMIQHFEKSGLAE